MSELRDLVVSIDFDDININRLLQVDSAMDEVEDQLRGMDRLIGNAADEIDDFGRGGSVAANRVENALEQVGDAATKLAAEMTVATTLIRSQLDDIADEADEAADEIGSIGWSAMFSAGKVVLLGTAITSVLTSALAGAVAAGAPLLLLVGALGASFLAAGAGVGAFGAVAVPAITSIFTAAEEVAVIEEKIANADTWKERVKAQQELAELYGGMSKAQKGALTELNEFKDFWSGFAKQFEDPIFNAFGGTLNMVEKIFTGLAPTIHNVADVVNELIEEMNTSIDGGGLKAFFSWLETNAAEAIYSFAHITGNLIEGVWNLFAAFSPVGSEIEGTLVDLTDKFASWSKTVASSDGFQNFIDYALTNGPVLWDTLSNIGSMLIGLFKSLAPFGTIVLSGLEAIIGKLSEMMPAIGDVLDIAMDFGLQVAEHWDPIVETTIALGIAVGAFAVAMKGLQIIGIVTAAMKVWAAGNKAAALSMIGLNGAMLANPITWVIAGIAALIGIGVLLYRNWDTVKEKAGDLWAWLKEKFDGIKDTTITALQPVIDFFGGLMDKWEDVKSSISSFKMPKIGLPKWLGGNGFIQTDGSHAAGLAKVPYDDYIARLHKDEAVLTASQADALRQTGVLGNDGNKPTLELSKPIQTTTPEIDNKINITPDDPDKPFDPNTGDPPPPIAGGQPEHTTNVNTLTAQITVQVERGENGQVDEGKIAQTVKKELEKMWMQLQLQKA